MQHPCPPQHQSCRRYPPPSTPHATAANVTYHSRQQDHQTTTLAHQFGSSIHDNSTRTHVQPFTPHGQHRIKLVVGLALDGTPAHHPRRVIAIVKQGRLIPDVDGEPLSTAAAVSNAVGIVQQRIPKLPLQHHTSSEPEESHSSATSAGTPSRSSEPPLSPSPRPAPRSRRAYHLFITNLPNGGR